VAVKDQSKEYSEKYTEYTKTISYVANSDEAKAAADNEKSRERTEFETPDVDPSILVSETLVNKKNAYVLPVDWIQ